GCVRGLRAAGRAHARRHALGDVQAHRRAARRAARAHPSAVGACGTRPGAAVGARRRRDAPAQRTPMIEFELEVAGAFLARALSMWAWWLWRQPGAWRGLRAMPWVLLIAWVAGFAWSYVTLRGAFEAVARAGAADRATQLSRSIAAAAHGSILQIAVGTLVAI